MSVSADVLAAREQLTRHGWVARNSESFRHLPPPPAALWLGEQVAESALQALAAYRKALP